MTQNIIELNGKRYDALSGQFLGSAAAPVTKSRRAHRATPTNTIDGVLPEPRRVNTVVHHAPTHAARPPKPTAHQAIHKPVMDVARPGTHHATPHHAEHSKTLMRHAVHKPKPSLRRQLKTQTRTDVLVKQPAFVVAPKLSFVTISERRLEHAKHIAQSKFISKFAPQAVSQQASIRSIRPIATAVSARPTVGLRQDIATPQPQRRTSPDIFEQALIHAKSHEEPPVNPKKHARTKAAHRAKKSRGRRAVTYGAASLAILLLLGFFAYQNQANIAVRVASMRTGFHVSLPGYQPTGFSFGNIKYSPGIATVSFHGNSDGRSYSVTQKTSNWDSQTLLNNFVASTNQSYQAYQAGGLTVYVYGNGNATWVGNGVWYQLSGNSELSNEQLVRLAASM